MNEDEQIIRVPAMRIIEEEKSNGSYGAESVCEDQSFVEELQIDSRGSPN